MKLITLGFPEERAIIFTNGEINNNKEIMKISKGKFYWKGIEVKDAKKVYERFSQ